MSSKIKTLLSDEESDKGEAFTINENFASKFEHNARRNLIAQGKLKFTENEIKEGA
jgi:hypothetical protein